MQKGHNVAKRITKNTKKKKKKKNYLQRDIDSINIGMEFVINVWPQREILFGGK